MSEQLSSSDKVLALVESERESLREELHKLKSCQITFLNLSITATGALLGLTRLSPQGTPGVMLYLAPLTILVPFWWIFFDKARTITRIVGYYRLLEGIHLGHYTATQFVGWETALGLFRKNRDKNKWRVSTHPRARLRDILLLQVENRYWILSYMTFAFLCGMCLLPPLIALRLHKDLVHSIAVFIGFTLVACPLTRIGRPPDN